METDKTETIVVIGYQAWGKGTTLAEAKKNMRNAGGALSNGYMILTFDKDTTFHGVDQHGRYEWTGNAPTQTKVPGKMVKA